MNAPASSSRQIVWPSVITVISAAILIGAEVFGAAFAGGWALAILIGGIFLLATRVANWRTVAGTLG